MSTPIGASSSSVSRRGSGRQRIQRYTTETNEEDTEFLGFFVKYSDLRGNIIKFPSTFTDRRGHLIDQYVVLDTSDRRRHYIGVERRNGNIWLSDDWNALSADCDIKLLDTIYFRHNYADFFDVVMFSPTGLEYRHGRTTPTELPVAFFKQIVTVDYFMKIAIPDEFTNAFRGILQNHVALFGPDDVEWMLECVMIDGSLWFTEGWTEVVVNYNIKKKDFIYFQVCEVNSVKVHIVQSDSGLIEKVSRIGRADHLDEDFRVRELWVAKISKASLRRRLPLYVPSRIVSSCLSHRPTYVTVLLPSGNNERWYINWSPGRAYACNIGKGWYKFKKEHDLRVGQRVRFSRMGYENRFIVEVD